MQRPLPWVPGLELGPGEQSYPAQPGPRTRLAPVIRGWVGLAVPGVAADWPLGRSRAGEGLAVCGHLRAADSAGRAKARGSRGASLWGPRGKVCQACDVGRVLISASVTRLRKGSPSLEA